MTDVDIERWGQCYHHCRRRLGERYGLGLTIAQYERICYTLSEAPRDLLAHGFKGREIVRIWHDGQPCTGVYDPREGLVVTFLSKGSAYMPAPKDRHARHRDRKLKRRKQAKRKRMSHKQLRQKSARGVAVYFQDWED